MRGMARDILILLRITDFSTTDSAGLKRRHNERKRYICVLSFFIIISTKSEMLSLKSHTSIVLQNYDFLSQCVINIPEPITKSPMIKFTAMVNKIFIQVCNACMSSFIDRVHSASDVTPWTHSKICKHEINQGLGYQARQIYEF